ncbi:hypothetical protein BUZ13_13195, partial [Staphylococcus gallinarum]
ARFPRGQLQPVVFSLSCSLRSPPKYVEFINDFYSNIHLKSHTKFDLLVLLYQSVNAQYIIY